MYFRMSVPTNSKPQNTANFSASEILRIRVKTEDSAFVYSILEASGGLCAYSTLEYRPGEAFRDLELVVPIGQRAEVDRVLDRLKDDLKGHLYALEVPENRNP